MNYIVANWKANKTSEEAKSWLKKMLGASIAPLFNCSIVVCAPFTLLSELKKAMEQSSHETIKLGVQDLSLFPSGAYTGEVSAEMLKGLVDYVIVGHSERRQNFGETDKIVAEKVKQALDNQIKPIICVDEPYLESQIQEFSIFNFQFSNLIFAYEPLRAIGTGKPDTPENANQVAKRIKNLTKKDMPVIYGGSVTDKNVKAFVDQENINGVLVGNASLKVEEFRKIIQACK